MKSFQHIILTGIVLLFLVACGNRGNTNRTDSIIADNELLGESALFQVEIDIDGMTMQELFLLRNSVYSGKLSTAMTPVEQALVDKIDQRLAHLQQENYIYTGYDTTANILNIVNIFQFRELIYHQEVMDSLAVNNYALLPDSLPQLFQVYQKNDSMQIPNFVTVDLMAQLSHIYENYVLRTVEEKHLAPMLAELCLALYNASVEQTNRAASENIKNLAAYNAAFFAVPYQLLTGKSLKTQGDYPSTVEIELAYIDQQESRRPALLEVRTNFDYSAFKPYGHYTRTAALRRYFKAWKWLQLAPYCSDNRIQLQRAVLVALALQTAKTESGVSAMDVYSRLTEVMGWFTGQPADVSLLDVALLLKQERITTVNAALNATFLARVTAMIGTAAAGKNPVINYPAVCRNGIYFVPQPDYSEEGSDASSFNKRFEYVQQKTDNSPVFAQKEAWNRKVLETSSALREKMKQSVLLYGVVPNHPEPDIPTDTITSKPLVKGYVEPALSFWTKLREWVELTDKTLQNYQLTTDTLTALTTRMHRYVALLEDAARHELNNERLPDETYRFIAHIGDSIRQFTLSMIEPKIDRWDWAAGTDRSVAINSIFVIVEIDGYLYLAKGATFKFVPQ